jgi:hypothetical protein
MSEQNDFQRYLERYQAEVPTGTEGEHEMRRRIAVPFMDTTEEDVWREPTVEELNGWRAYMGWSLWDVIAARSTEGESGLIPRQEYETISFLQMWSLYPRMFREITDAIGIDGVIELGRTPHREIGSKLNITRSWSPQNCCHLGRAIALQFNLESPRERLDDVAVPVQFARRMMHGTWGDGPAFSCGNDYQCALLNQEIVDWLLAAEERLDNPEFLATFRKFNAAAELLGFIVHYDCRFGLQDTGPYPVPGGGFMLARDHFLHEPAYPWTGPTEGLPYCVTQAMVFRPDVPVRIAINDIGTTFAQPKDYLQYLSGVAVFARDREDTPMAELRQVNAEEMDTIAKACTKATLELYKQLAVKDRDQKIHDGISVYATDHIRPMAVKAGLWDKFKPDIDELQPLTQKAWPLLADGQAAAVLAPLFVKGGAYAPLRRT